MGSLDDILAGVKSISTTGETVAQSYRTIVDKVGGGTPLVRPVTGFTPDTQSMPQVDTIAPGETLGFKVPPWAWWALGGVALLGVFGLAIKMFKR